MSERLKLLHVSRWAYLDACGVQAYLSNLSTALKGSSVDTGYAAVMPGTVPKNVEQPLSQGRAGSPQWMNVLRLGLWLFKNVSAFDVVHIHNAVSWQTIVGAMACLWHGKPYVVSPHGALYPWSLTRRPLRTVLYMRTIGLWLLRKAAVIIATTPVEAKVIQEIDKDLRVRVAAPGIPMPTAATARFTTSILSRELRIVFLGRLEPQKGLPVLLEAVSRLHANNIDARLDIIGKGEVEFVGCLREQAQNLAIEKATAFHGPLMGGAKLEAMRQADVFALPSNMENFSFATAEALALGLPVVVSEEVALASIIRSYHCGTVVPVGDAVALAQALAEYRDQAVWDTCAKNARECALREFSLEAMGRAHELLYREVALA